MDKKRLTAENGRPIADNRNVQTAGLRGLFPLKTLGILRKSLISIVK